MAVSEQNFSTEGDFDFTCTPCTPCTNEDRYSEAKKFCVECGDYFCSTCLSFHERFGATKGHALINCADVSTRHVTAHLTKCEIHKDKEEDMVCGEHYVICCRVCIATDHRSCKDIDYFPKAAENFVESTKCPELSQDLRCKIQELQMSCRAQKARLVQNKLRKVTLVKRLELFKTSMINLIESLVRDTEIELGKTIVPALHDVQQIQDTSKRSSRLNDALEDLTKEKDHLLIYRKAMECRQVLGDTHVEKCDSNLQIPACDATLNKIAQAVINSAKADEYLGVVKTEELDNTCDAPSICKIQDGSYCLALFQSSKIIRLDKNLKRTDTYAAGSFVWGLCATQQNEIAFTLPSLKKIHFLLFEKHPILRSGFSTPIPCRGIAYRDEKLYVTGGGFQSEVPGQINVFDLKGRVLQTFKNDTTGKLLFHIPRIVEVGNECIYVTDFQVGVICLNMHGKQQWVCKELKFPWGICFTDVGDLLIAGHESENIVLVSKNGETIGEILNKSDGLRSPQAVAFDVQNGHLLVTSNGKPLKRFDFEQFDI